MFGFVVFHPCLFSPQRGYFFRSVFCYPLDLCLLLNCKSVRRVRGVLMSQRLRARSQLLDACTSAIISASLPLFPA
jgi:hypothetical protein